MIVFLQIKLLTTAQEMLIVEEQEKKKEKETVLSERVPPLKLSGLSVQELQVKSLEPVNFITSLFIMFVLPCNRQQAPQ